MTQLNRREFVGRAAMAGAALVLPPEIRPAANPAPGAAPRAAARPGAFELDEVTIADLQDDMRTGKRTARSIVEAYLARIEEIDRGGPRVNSVIETNPDARAIADALDRERRAGRVRGRMHGIPVLIKDNIDTADRMKTSAGSLALANSVASRDALLVHGLRESGAIIIGKTNLSEWANFRSTKSVSGWSARGGLTRNPYALDRNPCGSSSGTGAAIAANLATVGVGTETDGSIVCPSNACGLVGIKPTVGLVSQSGIIPISHSQDTAGPMARTVRDAAILLDAMTAAGPGPADAARRSRAGQDYAAFAVDGGLRGARVGVARNYFGFNPHVDRVLQHAIDAMKDAGAVIVDPVEFPTKGKFDDAEFDVLLYEFKAGLNAYLAKSDAPYKSLAALIEFNEANREREMPYFGQEIFAMADKKGPLTSPEYLAALRKCRDLSRDQGIDALLAQHRLDAFVAPTGSPAWTSDLLNGDHFTGGSSTPAAVAGYPAITVPAGFVRGLPVGLSFMGAANSEPTLIRLAYDFERATAARKAPTFAATASLP